MDGLGKTEIRQLREIGGSENFERERCGFTACVLHSKYGKEGVIFCGVCF